MRILYDHQAIGLYRYGGISRYFHEIANRIAAIGADEVEIFAPLYVNGYFRPGDRVRPAGVYVPPIPRTLRAIRAANSALSMSLRLRQGIDIFHETYYSGVDRSPRRARRIVTVYDMTHERLPSYFTRSDDTPRLKAQAVRRADHVICISEHTRRDLVELLGIPEQKTSVVHLGYTLTAQPSEARLATSEKPYLLYVGHRNEFRNAARLLRVYAQSRALRGAYSLIFFGGGAFSAGECDMMRRLSLTGDDVMQISGDDGALAALYSGASALVYPSLYEGFGIPPLEAMSFGCPVICSNSSSLPEVAGEAAEFFDPEDDADMCRALEHVLTSSARAKLLVERGHQRCKQFSWEKCALETLKVYRKVLDGSV